MQLTDDPYEPPRGLLSGERCIEFPLLLLDEHLTELERKARLEKRTIGQMIRRAISSYVGGAAEFRDVDDGAVDSQPDVSRALVVTLLLPVSRLGQLEALAAQRGTTASALIRRVVCCYLMVYSSVQ